MKRAFFLLFFKIQATFVDAHWLWNSCSMEWKDLTHIPSTAHQPPTHIPSTAHQPPTHVPSTFNQRPINVGRTWIGRGWDVGRRLTSHPRPIHVLPTFQPMFTYVPSTSYATRTQHLSSHSSLTHLLSASYPIHPRFYPSPTHATSWCVTIHLVPIFHQLQFSLIPPPAHALSSSHPLPTYLPSTSYFFVEILRNIHLWRTMKYISL